MSWQVRVDGAPIRHVLPGQPESDRWHTESAAQLVACRFVAQAVMAGKPNPSDYITLMEVQP